MLSDILTRIAELGIATVFDVAPIIVILLVFQVVVLRRPLPNFRKVALGMIYVLAGLTLFLAGLEGALFPLGRSMATQLTAPEFVGLLPADAGSGGQWRSYGWVLAFAAAIGFAAAIAEPALTAVAIKVEEISGGTISATGLRLVVALGSGCGVTLGALRIVEGCLCPGAWRSSACCSPFRPSARRAPSCRSPSIRGW